jgi:hypothetical protein
VTIGPLKVGFSCEPNDLNATVVETEVEGSTGVPPAGRPGGNNGSSTTSTTDEADVEGTTALPKTGSSMLGPVVAAVVLLNLGYLFESAVRPARRRRRPDSWT